MHNKNVVYEKVNGEELLVLPEEISDLTIFIPVIVDIILNNTIADNVIYALSATKFFVKIRNGMTPGKGGTLTNVKNPKHKVNATDKDSVLINDKSSIVVGYLPNFRINKSPFKQIKIDIPDTTKINKLLAIMFVYDVKNPINNIPVILIV
jgi:hypothetical protein